MNKSLLIVLGLLLSINSFAGPGTTCGDSWRSIVHPHKLSTLYVKIGYEFLIGEDDWKSAYSYFEKASNLLRTQRTFSKKNTGICKKYMRLNSMELLNLDKKQQNLAFTTLYGLNLIDGKGNLNTFSQMIYDLKYLTRTEINGL